MLAVCGDVLEATAADAESRVFTLRGNVTLLAAGTRDEAPLAGGRAAGSI
jgi:hypothetical protein